MKFLKHILARYSSASNRELKQRRRRRQRERQKKVIGLDWQNNNFARASRFLAYFLARASRFLAYFLARASRFFVHFLAVVARLHRESV